MIRFSEKSCTFPRNPLNGYTDNCTDGFKYLSECSFRCHAGHHVSSHGVTRVACVSFDHVVDWDHTAADCVREYHWFVEVVFVRL